MDDDLQSLLHQLDIDENEVKNLDLDVKNASTPSDGESAKAEIDKASEEDTSQEKSSIALSANTEGVTVMSQAVEDADEGEITNHTKKYLTKLDDVTDEILAACRSDRQEAQDVIVLYKSQIEDALQSNRDPQRMYVDGLVQAVEVKSNINLAMVKIMEANAKMLASLKAGSSLNIKNNINVAASNDKELEHILDEPITEVDEY